MLPLNLTTNEVKNATAGEEEFLFYDTLSRGRIYAKSGEPLARPHRIIIRHEDIGVGPKRVRRSNIKTFKWVVSDVDSLTATQIICNTTIQIPVGLLVATTEPKNVLANHMSFIATTGAGTTVLFDCTGYGADSLINGTV